MTQYYHITRFLWLSSGLGAVLLLGRTFFAQFFSAGVGVAHLAQYAPSYLFFFIWNIFLAWVPYFLSLQVRKRSGIDWRSLGLMIAWLLFLPNAPYLITDLKHLMPRPPVPIWYDSVLFFLFAATGLLLGLFSMLNLDLFLRPHIAEKWRRPLINALWLLCGFGLYLGREGRWNSWDVVSRPWALLRYLADLVSGVETLAPAAAFSLVFAALLMLSYRGLSWLLNFESSK